jgi:release factor glutamine methyltransferase
MPEAAADWTIGRLIEWTQKFFDKKGIPQPRLEAEILLAHVLGLERIALYMQYEQHVSEAQRNAFRDMVKRRSEREPTRYLVGMGEFLSLAMKVTPACLIPRPETEQLVEETLRLAGLRKRLPHALGPAEVDYKAVRPAEVKAAAPIDADGATEVEPSAEPSAEDTAAAASMSEAAAQAASSPAAPPEEPVGQPQVSIIELCTGCGCIAVSLAANLPQAAVVASDISAEALAVARENAESHGVGDRVQFLEGDLYAPLDAADIQPADFLLANPPYVTEAEWEALEPEIRLHEPRTALVSGPQGTEIIERILKGAPAYLKAGGRLLMEIGCEQGPAVKELAAGVRGLTDIAVMKDYSNHDRILVARRA